ncbi:hypothetical protein [Alteromonas sp. W364]|uniref:hypothetical protein n=1 Tax=Alteromonas sp. W364 TaxID=3075610 RepID=UPI002884E485|nr:hypothetical protein [Alteromonas sp. W364]MDT0628061.1 hypothetical protein [Alteromonas sp. W364]
MNLTKVKQIFLDAIDADMFDDADFYEYMQQCFYHIDSKKNEMSDTQLTILLTVAASIAKTLGSIGKGEHDESITEEDKKAAHEKEQIIIEYMDYLTKHSCASLNNADIGEPVAQ